MLSDSAGSRVSRDALPGTGVTEPLIDHCASLPDAAHPLGELWIFLSLISEIHAESSSKSQFCKVAGVAGGRRWFSVQNAPKGATVRLFSRDQNSQGKGRPQRVVLAQNPNSGEFDLDLALAMA